MNQSTRTTAVVAYACACSALAAVVVGALGVYGVRAATSTGQGLARDELTTATSTAGLAHDVDAAYATAARLRTASGTRPGALAADLAAILYDVQVPAVEAGLAQLLVLHRDDPASEVADIDLFVRQWVAMRQAINSPRVTSARSSSGRRLDAAYGALSRHFQALADVEVVDARIEQAASVHRSRQIQVGIAASVLLMILGLVGCAVLLRRWVHRALEPARDQVEFADTLQLAGDEGEAHHLLQRHLERIVPHGTATVLNRNNSAVRLEAVTPLPPGSPLVAGLAGAEPRSCLAVRSGRAHDEDSGQASLMSCSVCSGCPGVSTCTPLTVGGEVIGSVLVNRAASYDERDRLRIRDAVCHAAPVLANLRNLAIAEMRAATDSLTGLPNKRAVGDTLHRMLAQASRTWTPLSMLMLDLDRFKDLNDRYGHQVGDQALANVGAALRSVLRDSDFAGRHGGEEFAVLLPDTDSAAALVTAERIRVAIADLSLPGLDVVITVSIGLATFPEHAASPERLERVADSALYVAKRSGRNRVEQAVAPDDVPVEVRPGPAGDPEAQPASLS